MSSKKFFVYSHLDDNGDVFYVGKGSGMRHASTEGRNRDWWDKVLNGNKISYSINILSDNMTEDDAKDLEGLVIQTIGLDNLTNVKCGDGYYIRHKSSSDHNKPSVTFDEINDAILQSKNITEAAKLLGISRKTLYKHRSKSHYLSHI